MTGRAHLPPPCLPHLPPASSTAPISFQEVVLEDRGPQTWAPFSGAWATGRGLDLGRAGPRSLPSHPTPSPQAAASVDRPIPGSLLPPGGQARACTLWASPVRDADAELSGTLRPIRRIAGGERVGVKRKLPAPQRPAWLSFRARRGPCQGHRYLRCGATCAAPGELRRAVHHHPLPSFYSWGNELGRPP